MQETLESSQAAGGVLTAKASPRRPGTAPALGLRAGSDVPAFYRRPWLISLEGKLIMAAALDAELIAALRMAKGRKMFFAFLLKGSDGKLIVSPSLIGADKINEAKKEFGGGSPWVGTCEGPFIKMVFKVTKAPPATMHAAIKKAVKRDAGLGIEPIIEGP